MRAFVFCAGAALGCGGAVTLSPSQGDGGSAAAEDATDGPSLTDSAAQAACDALLAAGLEEGCGGPTLPAAEVTRLRGRFQQVCENALALPGSGITPTGLRACASAISASLCLGATDAVGTLRSGNPAFAACSFRGSLLGGAPCNEDFQCASGACLGGGRVNTPGGPAPPTCGTCVAAAAVGQPCAAAPCMAGAQCASGASGTLECLTVAYGDLGVSCDNDRAFCNPGLFCDGTCMALPVHVDDPCVDSTGCAPPLICGGTQRACQQPGPSGAPCSEDQDCSAGLGCVISGGGSGVSVVGHCEAVTWVMPGQPCADPVRCLVGSCNSDGPQPRPQSPRNACPAVVPDGQLCGGVVCDTYSECFRNPAHSPSQDVCAPIDSTVCR